MKHQIIDLPILIRRVNDCFPIINQILQQPPAWTANLLPSNHSNMPPSQIQLGSKQSDKREALS